MDKPIVANNKPVGIELKAGEEYYFCTCGKSANQPFCEGSHKGTNFAPKAFVAEEDGEAYLCQCKQTGNPPFCDGTHTKIPDDKVGQEVALDAKRLANYFEASVQLMQVMARACGHDHLNQFSKDDLASCDRELAELGGIDWSGFRNER